VTKDSTDGTDPVGAEVTAPAGDAAEQTVDERPQTDQPRTDQPAGVAGPGQAGTEGEVERPGVVIRDKRKVRVPDKAPDGVRGAEPAEPTPTPAVEVTPADTVEEPAGTALGAELEALRRDLDELTKDLQRITAEYANYRKRVDRDRGLVAEQATGVVLVSLLPVLDDIDRAREHGDLVGPFGSVAEQLVNALTKFGLTPFGEKGDTFDPTRHEAVTHEISAEVKEPTCVGIMRRGYLLGDRLLRPALVAVADPE